MTERKAEIMRFCHWQEIMCDNKESEDCGFLQHKKRKSDSFLEAILFIFRHYRDYFLFDISFLPTSYIRTANTQQKQ